MTAAESAVKGDLLIGDQFTFAFRFRTEKGMGGELARLYLISPKGTKDRGFLRVSRYGNNIHMGAQKGGTKPVSKTELAAGPETAVVVTWDGKAGNMRLAFKTPNGKIKTISNLQVPFTGNQTLASYEVGNVTFPTNPSSRKPVHIGEVLVYRGALSIQDRNKVLNFLLKDY